MCLALLDTREGSVIHLQRCTAHDSQQVCLSASNWLLVTLQHALCMQSCWSCNDSTVLYGTVESVDVLWYHRIHCCYYYYAPTSIGRGIMKWWPVSVCRVPQQLENGKEAQNWQDGSPWHGKPVNLFYLFWGQRVKITGSQSVKALLFSLLLIMYAYMYAKGRYWSKEVSLEVDGVCVCAWQVWSYGKSKLLRHNQYNLCISSSQYTSIGLTAELCDPVSSSQLWTFVLNTST